APFASDTGTTATSASAAFVAARVALDAGGGQAESLFVRARDLDLVRFRAPSDFNAVVRDAARTSRAIYVPVAETFREAASEHIPGDAQFFEHVHPRPAGTVLIAHA